jgi:hypothetical protein
MECKSDYSRTTATCDNCSEEFSKYKRRQKRSEADLCSEQCKEQYWSENIAPEIESSGRSVELQCSYCESEITKPESWAKFNKTFCDKKCYGSWLSENNVGENHPLYNGGKSGNFTVSERRSIFKRDNYTCQDCGSEDESLNAHHIEPVSENPSKVHDTDNGVTLCVECHAERHPKLRKLILS